MPKMAATAIRTSATAIFDGVILLQNLIWLLSQPRLWAVLGVVVGPYLFYLGFRLFQRKRLILDIPRSSVRAAAIGAVEISGKAVGPYTLVSPLNLIDCLYYRVVISISQDRRNSSIVDEACAPLFVDDGTGEVMIFPKGAEIQWTAETGGGGEYLTHILAQHGAAREDLVGAQEYCIQPNDEIFVLGTLCENPWAVKDPLVTSLSRIGPGFVSFDEADILRREAFPSLDSKLPSGASQERDFNLYPPTILMRKQNPFVISTHSQSELLSDLTWKSSLLIWGGPLWTLWGLWKLFS